MFKKNITIILAALIVANNAVAVEITYYHNDVLGSPVATSDKNGDVKWQEQYRPYGEKINKEPASSRNEMWFTGKQHDDDTGLTYMNARYYDPVVGRFMATDPVDFIEVNPMSFNRYAYANNNPYKYIDPDGQLAAFAIPLLVAGGIVALAIIAPDPGGQRAESLQLIGDAIANAGPVFSDSGDSAPIDDLDVDGLAETGKDIDPSEKNKKEQLTRAGRAQKKHGGRDGSIIPRPDTGQEDQEGQDNLEDILTNPDAKKKKGPGRFGKGAIDVVRPDGSGASFDSSGTFRGFIEPRRR